MRNPGRWVAGVVCTALAAIAATGTPALARGTISAIRDFNPLMPGCAQTVYYVDIFTALAHYQPTFGSVTLLTEEGV